MRPAQHFIELAVKTLREGGLVAFPTETVYGLGADARNEAAVRRVFLAKKRPLSHPLIVHIASCDQLSAWAEVVSPGAWLLAKAFWPGPLTLVLPKRPEVLPLVTGGQASVAVRVPSHPLATALLVAFGDGLVAPSANRFMHISPTSAAAVREELGEAVDRVLDGGICSVGLESTIVDMTTDQAIILRPGMITRAAIEKVLGVPVATTGSSVRVPGQHLLHYAPITPCEWVEGVDLERERDRPLGVISPRAEVYSEAGVVWLGLGDDPVHYAHDLYASLRRLDQLGLKRILIEGVPVDERWDAIRDRLWKATGER